jgi:hypothetical protein
VQITHIHVSLVNAAFRPSVVMLSTPTRSFTVNVNPALQEVPRDQDFNMDARQRVVDDSRRHAGASRTRGGTRRSVAPHGAR